MSMSKEERWAKMNRVMPPGEFETVSAGLHEEGAVPLEFEVVDNGRYAVEFADKDGQPVFHIYAKPGEGIAWGRGFAPVLRPILEDIFQDGTLEWIPEAQSWYFEPARRPMDLGAAARMVLEKLPA